VTQHHESAHPPAHTEAAGHASAKEHAHPSHTANAAEAHPTSGPHKSDEHMVPPEPVSLLDDLENTKSPASCTKAGGRWKFWKSKKKTGCEPADYDVNSENYESARSSGNTWMGGALAGAGSSLTPLLTGVDAYGNLFLSPFLCKVKLTFFCIIYIGNPLPGGGLINRVPGLGGAGQGTGMGTGQGLDDGSGAQGGDETTGGDGTTGSEQTSEGQTSSETDSTTNTSDESSSDAESSSSGSSESSAPEKSATEDDVSPSPSPSKKSGAKNEDK
jgi:hypothetical protein